jgi:hypothetical protein
MAGKCCRWHTGFVIQRVEFESLTRLHYIVHLSLHPLSLPLLVDAEGAYLNKRVKSRLVLHKTNKRVPLMGFVVERGGSMASQV